MGYDAPKFRPEEVPRAFLWVRPGLVRSLLFCSALMKHKLFISALLGSSLVGASGFAQTKNVSKPVSMTGIVAGSPKGNAFLMRVRGQIYRVTVLPKVSLANVQGGDRVRVWGIPTRQNLQRANVRVVQKGASSNPDDFNPTS